MWAADLRSWSPPPTPSTVKVIELPRTYRSTIAAVMGPEADLVESRYRRWGCRCFVALDGPEIVAYGWLSECTEWIGEARLEITPGAWEGYIWNCVTLPAHRRKGIFTSLLIGIARLFQGWGRWRIWIASAGGAEKALSDAHFARILEVADARHLGLRRLTVWPVAGVDEATYAAARAVLALPKRPLARVPAARRH